MLVKDILQYPSRFQLYMEAYEKNPKSQDVLQMALVLRFDGKLYAQFTNMSIMIPAIYEYQDEIIASVEPYCVER